MTNKKLNEEWQDKVDRAFCVLEVDAKQLLYRIKDINKCNATPTVFINLDKDLMELIPEINILLDRLKQKGAVE